MLFLDSYRFACDACFRGHRSSICTHSDRDLIEIRKKGRPSSSSTSLCTQCNSNKCTHNNKPTTKPLLLHKPTLTFKSGQVITFLSIQSATLFAQSFPPDQNLQFSVSTTIPSRSKNKVDPTITKQTSDVSLKPPLSPGSSISSSTTNLTSSLSSLLNPCNCQERTGRRCLCCDISEDTYPPPACDSAECSCVHSVLNSLHNLPTSVSTPQRQQHQVIDPTHVSSSSCTPIAMETPVQASSSCCSSPPFQAARSSSCCSSPPSFQVLPKPKHAGASCCKPNTLLPPPLPAANSCSVARHVLAAVPRAGSCCSQQPSAAQSCCCNASNIQQPGTKYPCHNLHPVLQSSCCIPSKPLVVPSSNAMTHTPFQNPNQLIHSSAVTFATSQLHSLELSASSDAMQSLRLVSPGSPDPRQYDHDHHQHNTLSESSGINSLFFSTTMNPLIDPFPFSSTNLDNISAPPHMKPVVVQQQQHSNTTLPPTTVVFHQPVQPPTDRITTTTNCCSSTTNGCVSGQCLCTLQSSCHGACCAPARKRLYQDMEQYPDNLFSGVSFPARKVLVNIDRSALCTCGCVLAATECGDCSKDLCVDYLLNDISEKAKLPD